jgi:hypothetical protein
MKDTKETKTIRIYEAKGRDKKIIARAHLGTRRSLEVFDEAYRRTLSILFETPRPVGMRSELGPPGQLTVGVQKLLEPWSAEALREVIDHELPRIGLRVELSSTSVRKYQA